MQIARQYLGEILSCCYAYIIGGENYLYILLIIYLGVYMMKYLMKNLTVTFIYSFTLPAEILLIMYFEQKQNTIRIGTTEIATPR